MNIAEGYLILIARAGFEVVKRIFYIAAFPACYVFRRWARAKFHNNRLAFILWAGLDDFINTEAIQEFAINAEYCPDGSKRFGPIEKLPPGWVREFLRAYHWGAFRNNGINLSRYLAAGNKIAWRKFGALEARIFFDGKRYITLPYFEKIFFGFRLQCGWISNGRFEMEFRGGF